MLYDWNIKHKTVDEWYKFTSTTNKILRETIQELRRVKLLFNYKLTIEGLLCNWWTTKVTGVTHFSDMFCKEKYGYELKYRNNDKKTLMPISATCPGSVLFIHVVPLQNNEKWEGRV